MKASKLIAKLQKLIDKHGDHNIDMDRQAIGTVPVVGAHYSKSDRKDWDNFQIEGSE